MFVDVLHSAHIAECWSNWQYYPYLTGIAYVEPDRKILLKSIRMCRVRETGTTWNLVVACGKTAVYIAVAKKQTGWTAVIVTSNIQNLEIMDR